MVLVQNYSERLPFGSSKKLNLHNASPFKIIKKISVNAYVLDFPPDLAINPTFNVEDITMGTILMKATRNKLSHFKSFQ